MRRPVTAALICALLAAAALTAALDLAAMTTSFASERNATTVPQATTAPARSTAPPPAPAVKVAQPAPPSPQPAAREPSREQVILLVRSTVLALGDANRTGNYSVLRDLASPAFQARTTTTDLVFAFADLRRAGPDLALAALRVPELAAAPHIDAAGRLAVKGTLALTRHRLEFDLAFEPVAGHWRLAGIAISLEPQVAATRP